MKQIQDKVNENRKLGEERSKLIGSLDSNFKVLQLEIEEIQSIEYPQDVDVEVMVEYSISDLFIKLCSVDLRCLLTLFVAVDFCFHI